MNRQILGFFETRDAAIRVLSSLQALGLSQGAMHIYGSDEAIGRGGELLPDGPGTSTHLPDALFAGVQNLLADIGLAGRHQREPISAESAISYAEGLRRGGVILGVEADEQQASEVVRILKQAGAVDLDAHAQR